MANKLSREDDLNDLRGVTVGERNKEIARVLSGTRQVAMRLLKMKMLFLI